MDSDLDSDGEEEKLLERAFEIKYVDDYDPEEMPTNGYEYLMRVKHEAKRCPKVKVAEIDMKKFDDQTFIVPKRETYSVPVSYLPTEEWQREQVEAFSRVRDEVSYFKSQRGTEELNNVVNVTKPEKWFDYIYGRDGTPGEVPWVKDLIGMNEASLCRALDLFESWLDEGRSQLNDHTCLWIYSLLAFIATPLLPETCACLRSLACHAIKARADVGGPDDKALVRANLLVCLVGRYFSQADLADNN